MGQSFGRGPSGRWVRSCDECGAADGSVRRIRCPFRYCYPACLCSDCRSAGSALSVRLGAPWVSRRYHVGKGCDAKMRAADARRQLERDQGRAGVLFLHSAMSVDATDPATGAGIVQVVLGAGPWGEPSPERWVLMRADTYDGVRRAVGAERTPTLDDFRAGGPVFASPVGYHIHGGDVFARAWAEARDPLEGPADPGLTTKEIVPGAVA